MCEKPFSLGSIAEGGAHGPASPSIYTATGQPPTQGNPSSWEGRESSMDLHQRDLSDRVCGIPTVRVPNALGWRGQISAPAQPAHTQPALPFRAQLWFQFRQQRSLVPCPVPTLITLLAAAASGTEKARDSSLQRLN